MSNGLITVESAYNFSTTLSRLMAAVQGKSLTIFAVVDHGDGAEIAGLTLAPTTLVIFGNAKGGTPLMQKDQRVGIDLPLKALVWQDAAGVHITINDPSWIAARHGLEPESGAPLAATLKAIVEQAAAK